MSKAVGANALDEVYGILDLGRSTHAYVEELRGGPPDIVELP